MPSFLRTRRTQLQTGLQLDTFSMTMTILCYSHVIAKVLVEELRAEDAESDRFVALRDGEPRVIRGERCIVFSSPLRDLMK